MGTAAKAVALQLPAEGTAVAILQPASAVIELYKHYQVVGLKLSNSISVRNFARPIPSQMYLAMVAGGTRFEIPESAFDCNRKHLNVSSLDLCRSCCAFLQPEWRQDQGRRRSELCDVTRLAGPSQCIPAADVMLSAHLKPAYPDPLILCVSSNCLAQASCNAFDQHSHSSHSQPGDFFRSSAITQHHRLRRAALLQGLLSPLEVHLAWLGPDHHGLKVRLWKRIYQLEFKPSEQHAPN